MRKSALNGVVAVALGLLTAQIGRAQGSGTYVSNIGQASAGSIPVGSDSWLAAGFVTGANSGGYSLNSVQLGMANGTGSPSGFTVMIYSEADIAGASRPVNNLGTLVGPSGPANSGNYIYTATGGIILSPTTEYYVVMTAGTAVANGAFSWCFLNAYSYNSTDGWDASVALGSSNGSTLSWTRLGSGPGYDNAQFAINATPTPEPGVVILLAMGGLLIGVKHRNETKRS